MRLFKRNVIGALQTPADGAAIDSILRVEGWVLSRFVGRPELTFWVDGKEMDAEAKWSPRPDVFKVHDAWPTEHNPAPGFSVDLPAILLAPGNHTLVVKARHASTRRTIARRVFCITQPVAASDRSSAKTHMAVRDRVLFMHIPKTAGTSLNAYLFAHFKPSRVALHIEYRKLDREWESSDFENKELITGHLKYDQFHALFDLKHFFFITVLRDPRKQVMSQLAWHQRLLEPEHAEQLQSLRPVLADMVRRLADRGLVEFLCTLKDEERLLFDNACARRLATVSSGARLDSSTIIHALERLASFDLVGITERMEESLWLLAFYMGWEPVRNPPRLNVAKSDHYAAIDSADEELNRAIDDVTAADVSLYRHANLMLDQQVENMIRLLCEEFPAHDDALMNPVTQPAAIVELLHCRAVRASGKIKR